MNRSINKFFSQRGKVFYSLLTLLVVVVAVSTLELTNTTHIFHQQSVPQIIPVANQQSGNQGTGHSDQTSGSQSSGSAKNSGSAGGASSGSETEKITLRSPYGQFVSNHSPGAGGSPTTEDSHCATTTGARCYIKFTRSDGTTSQLPSQTANSDGLASWSWNSNILSSGSWTVTAVASLNGQIKTAQDPILLTIK